MSSSAENGDVIMQS